jgi:hypothetical protein
MRSLIKSHLSRLSRNLAKFRFILLALNLACHFDLEIALEERQQATDLFRVVGNTLKPW